VPPAIGIDVGARLLDVVALDARGEPTDLPRRWDDPRALAAALAERLPGAHIGVDAPLRTGEGLLRDDAYRATIDPPPPPGKFANYRECDYQLIRRGMPLYQAPSTYDACDAWMRAGFALHDALLATGRWTLFDGAVGPPAVLEVYPFACYCALLGSRPPRKSTAAGRAARLAALDGALGEGWCARADLASEDAVDAAVCALTALRFGRGEAHWVGNPREALMVLPSPLRDRYGAPGSTTSRPADPGR